MSETETAPAVIETASSAPAPEAAGEAITEEKGAAPSSAHTWPELASDHPLSKLAEKLPSLLKDAEYSEVYGIDLANCTTFQRNIILQKFLRANSNDLSKAEAQLLSTLKWRKSYEPLKTKDEVYSKKKFGGLGYVTQSAGVPESSNAKDVITYNIYGAVKDNKETFGDIDAFMRWRVGIMELGLEKLDLASATEPIPDFGKGRDPHQGIQIHDYLNVSFLRQDPHAKAAAKKAIEVFSAHYPETLSRKFFVNVPVVMGWVFTAMKMVLSRETVRKFTVLSYGKDLALELGKDVPSVYGGDGKSLEEIGVGLKMEE